jgi:hypothetical protein
MASRIFGAPFSTEIAGEMSSWCDDFLHDVLTRDRFFKNGRSPD